MLVPCKRGPTSGVGQYLAKHVRQGAKEWLDIGRQDVPDVPLDSVERSDIETRTVELGHERWIPDHTPVINKADA